MIENHYPEHHASFDSNEMTVNNPLDAPIAEDRSKAARFGHFLLLMIWITLGWSFAFVSALVGLAIDLVSAVCFLFTYAYLLQGLAMIGCIVAAIINQSFLYIGIWILVEIALALLPDSGFDIGGGFFELAGYLLHMPFTSRAAKICLKNSRAWLERTRSMQNAVTGMEDRYDTWADKRRAGRKRRTPFASRRRAVGRNRRKSHHSQALEPISGGSESYPRR